MLLARHGTRGAIPVRIGQHKGKRLRTEKPILFYLFSAQCLCGRPLWRCSDCTAVGFQRHHGRVSTPPKHYFCGSGGCMETNRARAIPRAQSEEAEAFHLTVSLHPFQQSFYCLAGSSSREMTNSCSMASFHQASSAWKVEASSPLYHGMNHAQRAPAAHCSEINPTVELVDSP